MTDFSVGPIGAGLIGNQVGNQGFDQGSAITTSGLQQPAPPSKQDYAACPAAYGGAPDEWVDYAEGPCQNMGCPILR
jgi:hypothetical protein